MARYKIIIIGTLLCCSSGLLSAQNQPNAPLWKFGNPEQNKFHFGILLQYNQPWYQIVHSDAFIRTDSFWAVNVQNGTGFSLGIMFDWNINKYIQLRTNLAQLVLDYRRVEFNLQYPDFRESAVESKLLETPYLQWPLIIKVQSDLIENSFRVYMYAGGMINIDIGEKRLQTIRSLLTENNDWGVLGGIGFHLYFGSITISPQIQFSAGMNNIIATDTKSKFNHNIKAAYNRSLSFSLVISP